MNAAPKRQARVGLSSHVPGPRDNKEIAMSDLTTITTPFGLLDEATRKALKNCGGPYDRWSPLSARWSQYLDDMTPSFDDGLIYRQRPEPTRPLVVRDWSVFADWVKAVTRDKDGRIDVWDGKPEPVIDQWDCPRGVGGAELSHQLSPTIIDPGTCDWREAICERPDESELLILSDAEALEAADALAKIVKDEADCYDPEDDGAKEMRAVLTAYRKARGGE